MMRHRRSVRAYTQEKVPDEKIRQIIQAGLLSASGKAIRPWEIIVVKDKEMLKKMAGCRENPVKMLENGYCALVVLGDSERSDVWIEDCSGVMANMHLMADALGVGSCWVQGRLRKASDGRSTEEYLRELLNYPGQYRLEAILALGMAQEHPQPYQLEELNMEKVHDGQF